MRIHAIFAIAALSVIGAAQQLQIELEADRKPNLVTAGNCLIHAGRVLTATKGTLENVDILVTNGKIAQIGKGLKAPVGYVEVDARDKVIMPGIVDGHSHRASDGTNEGADSITGEVRIEDVLNLSALNVWQALASGHTSAISLHGSANSVGGQSIVLKYKYMKPAAEAVVKDAPRMIKFALGENVTRKSDTSTTGQRRYPNTRMGVESVYRRAFTEAKAYMAAWEDYRKGTTKTPPRRDLRLETLSDILKKKIWVQCHSYRSDEMLMMVRLSQEFGFKIGAMQHALEAYKIAPELAKAGVGVSMFVDSWSFKQEGYDSIPFNASICTKAGVLVSINTDGLSGTTALNIDAAKTMRFGGLTEQQAIQTITINPARELGIAHRTGSIEVGKDADLGFWSGHPLSVYSRCAMTMVEGEVYFQRRDAFGVDKISTIKQTLDAKKTFGETPVPKKSDSYAIVGATVHTVSGPVLDKATVVVSNGKITAVGKSVAIPKGATTINGAGLHVYPGFIDGYSTIGLAEISPIPVTLDNAELGTNQPDLDGLTALWTESAHFGPARYNGVTNAFMGPNGGTISGQGSVINTDGYTSEGFGIKRKAGLLVNFTSGGRNFDFDVCDDILDAARLLGLGGATDGHKAGEFHGDEDLTLDQREQYFDLLGGRIQGRQPQPESIDPDIDNYFATAKKYMTDKAGGKIKKPDLSMEAMIPYLKGEKKVFLTTRSASSIRSAVAFGKKYGLKIVLRGANEAWKEAKFLKDNNISVILNPAGKSTLGANGTDQPWDPYDTAYVNAGVLARAGVKFCFQSGGGSDVMMLPVRVGQDCAYGLSKADAIRSLTLSAAEILGVNDQIGSIEPGKRANIIVTDGDPLEMTSMMRYVFIDGQPRPLVSKHTMLRDKYLARLK